MKNIKLILLLVVELIAIGLLSKNLLAITIINFAAFVTYLILKNKTNKFIDAIYLFLILLTSPIFMFLVPVYVYYNIKLNKIALTVITIIFIISSFIFSGFNILASISFLALGLILVLIINEFLISNTQEKDTEVEKLKLIQKIASSISHEIKNPISSLLGIAQLIRSDESILKHKNQVTKIIDIIEEESEKLHNLANDFLSYSRPEKQKEEALSLIDLLQNIVAILNTNKDFIDKKLNIKTKYDSTNSYIIYGDYKMLNQALTNLILNAIQASPENEEIEISLKENEASITIHIKDKGVSKDLNDKIFEPFYTTKAKGTGLGLSISKNIINAHNGSIKFESKDTETIFIVSFIKTQEI